jgi:hypothetical protein
MFNYLWVDIKKGDPKVSSELCEFGSHEVLDCNTSVVTVAVDTKTTCANGGSFCKWVRNHAVAGLESDFWLEGVLTDCTYHLQRYIWAVEETCVIR